MLGKSWPILWMPGCRWVSDCRRRRDSMLQIKVAVRKELCQKLDWLFQQKEGSRWETEGYACTVPSPIAGSQAQTIVLLATTPTWLIHPRTSQAVIPFNCHQEWRSWYRTMRLFHHVPIFSWRKYPYAASSKPFLHYIKGITPRVANAVLILILASETSTDMILEDTGTI